MMTAVPCFVVSATDVAVITAVPRLTPMTTPVELMVATAGADVDHVTVRTSAGWLGLFSTLTSGTSVICPPTTIVA
jgi:hypothetical protein